MLTKINDDGYTFYQSPVPHSPRRSETASPTAAGPVATPVRLAISRSPVPRSGTTTRRTPLGRSVDSKPRRLARAKTTSRRSMTQYSTQQAPQPAPLLHQSAAPPSAREPPPGSRSGQPPEFVQIRGFPPRPDLFRHSRFVDENKSRRALH